jgi:hypothetical protein
MYGKVSKAWKSPGFVPSISFQDVQDLSTNNRRASLTEIEAEASRKRSMQHTEYPTEKV